MMRTVVSPLYCEELLEEMAALQDPVLTLLLGRLWVHQLPPHHNLQKLSDFGSRLDLEQLSQLLSLCSVVHNSDREEEGKTGG